MKTLATKAWVWASVTKQSAVRDQGSVTEETAIRVLLVAAAITAGGIIAGLIISNANAIESP